MRAVNEKKVDHLLTKLLELIKLKRSSLIVINFSVRFLEIVINKKQIIFYIGILNIQGSSGLASLVVPSLKIQQKMKTYGFRRSKTSIGFLPTLNSRPTKG